MVYGSTEREVLLSTHRWARAAALALLFLAPGIAPAGDQLGTRAFPFLRIGVDARATGMGDAYSAVADGAEAAEWNPAGLAVPNHPTLTSGYLKYLSDMHAGSLSFAQPVGRRFTWGLSVRFFTVGGIPRTTVENPTGEGLGEFSSTDLCFKAAFALRVTSRIALGMTGGVVTGTIDEATAYGFTSDYGLLIRDLIGRMRVAAAVRNAGTMSAAYVGEVDPLPTEIVFGLAHPFIDRKLLLAGESAWSVDRGTEWHVGAEWEPVTDFFVRSGYRTEGSDLRDGERASDLAGLAFGVGFGRVREYRIDYAYASMGDLGNTHRFTFAWIFR